MNQAFGFSNKESQQEKTELTDLKKKRDEYNLEIRKKKREDILGRKRNRNLENEQKTIGEPIGYNLVEDPQLRECVDQWVRRPFHISELVKVIDALGSSDLFQQHYGIIGIRKLLSAGEQTTIQSVIDANLIPKLINFANDDKEPHLQLEAAWALTNVAAGTTQQTQSILDKGGVQCFIRLLSSKREEIAEQAIWAIGNISGDSSVFRDKILHCGGLDPLIAVINKTTQRAIIKHGSWALSNLCRGKPLPDLELVGGAIPTICKIIMMEEDLEVLTDAAWALAYLSRKPEKIALVVSSGIVPKVIQYLSAKNLGFLVPCLRIVGNIIVGAEASEEIQPLLMEPEFLPKMMQLVQHPKKAIKKETCWTISNLVAISAEVTELVVGNPEYMKILLETATSESTDVQKEAVWIFANATLKSNPQQVSKLIENGVLEMLIYLLKSKEAEVIEISLETIWNILNWGAIYAHDIGSRENIFLVELENKNGVQIIEDLQSHPNNSVYLKALKILEEHFDLETPL